MSQKIKPGTFFEEIKEERLLWRDKKRWALFGLPWTFTTYELTDSRLRVISGFFKKTEDDVKLYRVSDVTFYQKLFDRINRLSSVCVISSDPSQPEVHMVRIKNGRKVKDLIQQKVEEARREKGVMTSEIVGAGSLYNGVGHAQTNFNTDPVTDEGKLH